MRPLRDHIADHAIHSNGGEQKRENSKRSHQLAHQFGAAASKLVNRLAHALKASHDDFLRTSRPNGSSNRRHRRGAAPAPTEYNDRLGEWNLLEWNIDLRLETRLPKPVFDVAYNTDDLTARRKARSWCERAPESHKSPFAEVDISAHSILPAEVAPRQLLVNDHNRSRIRAVGISEHPPPQERNVQGSEVVLANVVVTCVRSFVVLRRRLTSHAERNLIRATNRHSVYDRDRTHSGQSLNPLCEETEETRLLCRALVLSRRQRYTNAPDA